VALVLDTGPLLALLDANDPHHGSCSELIVSARERRVIPSPVLPEIDHLVRAHVGVDGFAPLLQDVRRGTYDVEDLVAEDYERVQEVLQTYRDLGIGFVDAAVLSIVERLGEPKLMTLDRRHFAAMRPRHREALELLPAL
jgi:predicted nucleic acid-binding protein